MSIKYPIFHTGKGHLMFFHGWEPKKTQNGKELFSTTFIFPKEDTASYERYKQRDTAEGTVPSVAGMGLREAVATLERAGLRVVEVKGAGHVVGQVPKAGSVIRKNEKATLQLSSDI